LIQYYGKKSEGVPFRSRSTPYSRRRRCLVPATQYFEWTTNPADPKGRKLMWRFTVPDQPIFALAGLWDYLYWGVELEA
jgi:putative SOS response-associated peptidase YedK